MLEFRPTEGEDTEAAAGFRVYDAALRDLFTIKYQPKLDDKSVELVIVPIIGPLQREYSTQEKLNPEDQNQSNIKTDKTVKLPAISLTRLNWEMDLRRWSRADYRRLKWSEDGKRVHWSPHPMPFDIIYQMDIWTKFRTTMNQLVRKILIKFVYREVWLSVNLGGEFGTRKVPLKLMFGGPNENFSYEMEELEDRTIRTAISFVLQAWVIPDGVMRPTVQQILLELQPKNIIPADALINTDELATKPTLDYVQNPIIITES